MYKRSLNWNYQIKEAKPQLDIFVYQMKPSVLKIGYI